MLQKGKVWWLLGLSLLVYSLWQRWPLRLTPAEFEFAFPLLAAVHFRAGHGVRMVQSRITLFCPHAGR